MQKDTITVVLRTIIALMLSSCKGEQSTPFKDSDGDAYLTLDTSKQPEFMSFCNKHVEELEKEGLIITGPKEVSIQIRLCGYRASSPQEDSNTLRISSKSSSKTLTLQKRGKRYFISADQFFASMDGAIDCCYDRLNTSASSSLACDACHTTLRKAEKDDEPRCIDYNGKFSDGVNYPKSDWRALRNFIGSDCYEAVKRGYCLMEHASKEPSCYRAHGGKICTELVKN